MKFNCPVCGTELSVVANKDNQSNDIDRQAVFKGKTSEEKIEILRKAGIDVSNLFSIKNVTTEEDAVGRMVDGKLLVLSDNDLVLTTILHGGTIPNRRLFRRWVMAQVFHMMTETDYGKKNPVGFTEALKRKGYKYQWNVVVEEYRVQAKLFASDLENFAERNRWFNKEVAVAIAGHYIQELKKVIEKTPVKKCKGVPYVRLQKHDVFIDDLQTKVYKPLEKALINIKKARSANALYNAVSKFYNEVKKTYITHHFSQSKDFKDAYKGAGAFFTLKNLILFHGCIFPEMNQEASLEHLKHIVKSDDFEGYKLFGVLKEFLVTNKIDIAKKQAEWRK